MNASEKLRLVRELRNELEQGCRAGHTWKELYLLTELHDQAARALLIDCQVEVLHVQEQRLVNLYIPALLKSIGKGAAAGLGEVYQEAEYSGQPVTRLALEERGLRPAQLFAAKYPAALGWEGVSDIALRLLDPCGFYKVTVTLRAVSEIAQVAVAYREAELYGLTCEAKEARLLPLPSVAVGQAEQLLRLARQQRPAP